jgi:hypothetical protein
MRRTYLFLPQIEKRIGKKTGLATTVTRKATSSGIAGQREVGRRGRDQEGRRRLMKNPKSLLPSQTTLMALGRRLWTTLMMSY